MKQSIDTLRRCSLRSHDMGETQILGGGRDRKFAYKDEDGEGLLTLSQRFQRRSNSSIPKKLKMRPGTKRKGHSWKSVKSLTKKVGSERPTRTRRCNRKWAEKRKFDDRFEVQTTDVIERAAEFQSSLDPKFPSFFKLMLRSHVTLGFWLGLPMEFWRLHLPKCDTNIILEGEDGVEYQTKFLSEKVGLSGGWRGFSLVHKLREGDVVVFHLVRPCKFKVYIVRTNRLAEVDGALNLIHLDNSESAPDFACNDMDINICELINQSHQIPLIEDIHHETPLENDKTAVNSCLTPVTDESDNGREVVTSEDMGDCGISNLSNSFVEFHDFKIIVNGSIIDSELSKHLHDKYYELCCTRKSYLHECLKCTNQTLAAGIISETINIADAIRASKLSTSVDSYANWDKTLEAFELMGMDVGFIRARLNRLLGLVGGSTEAVDPERYEVASCERDQVKEVVRGLERKLLELNQAVSRLEKEMESLKEKAERYEIMFQEEASAPW